MIIIYIYIYQPWLTSHVPRLLQTQLPHERSESNLLLVSSKDPRNTFRQTTTSGTYGHYTVNILLLYGYYMVIIWLMMVNS